MSAATAIKARHASGKTPDFRSGVPWLQADRPPGMVNSTSAVDPKWRTRAGLFGWCFLGLQLHQDQLERLVADVFRQMLTGVRPLDRPALHRSILSLSVRQREPRFAISQKNRHAIRVMVHHRLFVCWVRYAQHAHTVIL